MSRKVKHHKPRIPKDGSHTALDGSVHNGGSTRPLTPEDKARHRHNADHAGYLKRMRAMKKYGGSPE